MTEAMPFLQKYDITFLRPPTIRAAPFVRFTPPPTHYRHLRHIVTNRLIVYVFCVTQVTQMYGRGWSSLIVLYKKALLYGELSNEVRLRG